MPALKCVSAEESDLLWNSDYTGHTHVINFVQRTNKTLHWPHITIRVPQDNESAPVMMNGIYLLYWLAIFRSSSQPAMETGMKPFEIATCRLLLCLSSLYSYTYI